ncbi:MAG TPA: response regulator, partial [Candidatus Eisenbacteria bacterium]|nr:response regulator [Candidatus Eisenbacteria bacterium]
MAFRVLFVEDDPALALMYRTGLEARGYDVAVARDGCEGLEMARAWEPDLMLLDVGLPGLDGVQ